MCIRDRYYVFKDNVRETAYMIGSRREIEQEMLMIKLADQLGGYQLFPYKDYKEYMSKGGDDWTRDEIYSWWDKPAMITKKIQSSETKVLFDKKEK